MIRAAAAFILTVILTLCSTAVRADEPSFTVLPMPLDRGTAARVIAEGLNESSGLAGTFDNRPVLFFPAGGKLYGFLGADVMLSPGHYPLKLTWNGGSKELDVSVRDKSYGVRSIKVPQKQVDLSKSDLDRVNREKALVTGVLETVSPKRLWRGPWTDPVGGKVNSSFGRQTKVNGVLNPRPHSGADFAVPEGTPVKAPADGVVLMADFHFFSGGAVYLDHGQGLISMYFHLSELKVKPGDQVKRGDILALSGKTGRVTGAHLHYGVYLCQARLDPVVFHRLTALLPRE
ncbi:peptidase M23 [Deltaproteobacteria bacterium Smac51]|nr:peptidase M23 [Deltaproteobacteria bacterium Smac51]